MKLASLFYKYSYTVQFHRLIVNLAEMLSLETKERMHATSSLDHEADKGALILTQASQVLH